jgi:hypothetical protein
MVAFAAWREMEMERECRGVDLGPLVIFGLRHQRCGVTVIMSEKRLGRGRGVVHVVSLVSLIAFEGLEKRELPVGQEPMQAIRVLRHRSFATWPWGRESLDAVNGLQKDQNSLMEKDGNFV